MKQDKNTIIERRHGLLIVDGEYFAPDDMEGKPIFIKLDKKEVRSKLKLIKTLIPLLKEGLNKEAILEEALMKMGMGELAHIQGMFTSMKSKPKVKTRKGHCVDLMVGDTIIPLINNEGL